MSRQYKELSDPRQAAVNQEGTQGTSRHRLGGKSFGQQAFQLEREAERVTKRRRGDAVACGALVPVMEPSSVIVAFSTSLVKSKQDTRATRHAEKEAAHERGMQVKTWRETDGVNAVDREYYDTRPNSQDAR